MVRVPNSSRPSPSLDDITVRPRADAPAGRDGGATTSVSAAAQRFESMQAVARSMPVQAAAMVALVGVFALLLQGLPGPTRMDLAAIDGPQTTGSLLAPSLRPTLP